MRPEFEVADIIARYGALFERKYGGLLTWHVRKTFRDLSICRTKALGGHARKCADCEYQEDISYNSCRNIHCPKCGGSRRARWFEARMNDILPVKYFHIVFTLPEQLRHLALQNERLVYGYLFSAASQTLQELAREHFGAQIGFFAALHTWGQQMGHHPHLHCVVPSGGLSLDESKWISRDDFFLPIAALRKRFRYKLLKMFEKGYERGELRFYGTLSKFETPEAFARLLKPLWKKKWVVYLKPPFAGPKVVLKYLANYTHRVAISNHRLVSISNGTITFRYKDYADSQKRKTLSLSAVEFLRRFSLHVLPHGFMRIRHFGLFCNHQRKAKLEKCRDLLPDEPDVLEDKDNCKSEILGQDELLRLMNPQVCPKCGCGILRRIVIEPLFRPHFWDTS